MINLIFFVSAAMFLHIAFKIICFTVYMKKAYYGTKTLKVTYNKGDENKTIVEINYWYLHLIIFLLAWWALMLLAYLGGVKL